MPAPRDLATLWVYGHLSALERMCLRSMLAQGHQVTLYTYDDVAGVPDGVVQRDANEILSLGPYEPDMLLPGATIADIFRLTLMQKTDEVWMDSDMLLLRPLATEETHIYGRIVSGRVNNAVMALPQDSPVPGDILAAFYTQREQFAPNPLAPLCFADFEAFRARVVEGTARRGDYGPRLFGKALRRDRKLGRAVGPEVFSPIDFNECEALVLKGAGPVVRGRIGPETIGVHLWAHELRKHIKAKQFSGLEGSYLAEAMHFFGEDWAAFEHETRTEQRA
ncbi:MAG: hypothetical protein AAGJ96_00445 [Pseudomonadota bacterium]